MQLFKKSSNSVRAWWHRCAHLPRETTTFFSLLRVYHVLDTLFFAKKPLKSPIPKLNSLQNTMQNALYIVHFWKKVVIPFERGDFDVRPSHAKQQLFFFTFSNVSRVWHTLLVLWSSMTQVIINLWLHLTLFQLSCEDFKCGFEKVALVTLSLPQIDKRTKAYVRGCTYVYLHTYILTYL